MKMVGNKRDRAHFALLIQFKAGTGTPNAMHYMYR